MKKLLVDIARAVLVALYALLRRLPTRPRIVCISRQSDAEPVDFQLIRAYIDRHHPDYETVVLAKALKSPVRYLPHMIRQLYYIATSRAVVLDSYCIVVGLLAGRLRVPVVQLWHAMGNMKKFGYADLDEPEGRSSETARLLGMHRGYDSIVISSMSFAADYAAGFGCDPAVFFESPLPKADLLVEPALVARERARVLAAYPQLDGARTGKRTIVYAPTFRRTPAPNEAQAMRALLACVDFDRYELVFMPHPVSDQRIDDPRIVQNRDRALNMLYAADIVVSDYSTVIYEAGLLGAPVYLYAYDWDTYAEKRSLNLDIWRDVPAFCTADARALMDAIDADAFDAQAYARFIRQNIALPEEGTCTGRIVGHILGLIRPLSS